MRRKIYGALLSGFAMMMSLNLTALANECVETDLMLEEVVKIENFETYEELECLQSNNIVNTIINFARSKIHSSAYNGYCQKFVKECYEAAGIYSNVSAGSANEAKRMWRVSNDLNNIPVGACIYFKDAEGGGFGHVAIYLGNDRMIHTVKGVYSSGNSNIAYVEETSLSYFKNKGKVECWGYQAGYDIYSGTIITPTIFSNTSTENITETSAKIKTSLNSTYSVSTCGFYFGTSEQNMSKVVENANTKVNSIWYSLGNGSKWISTLEKGRTYYYQFFAVINGVEHKSEICTFRTSGSSDVTPPTISNVKFERISADTVRISCQVTDESNITKVSFPTWTEHNGQDDLILPWENNYVGIKNGSIYSFDIKDSEHKYEKGKYVIHIYAWDELGNQAKVDNTYYEFKNQYNIISSVNYNGHSYELYDDILTWQEAKEKCERLGGHLVTVNSKEEQDVLTNLMNNGRRACYFKGSFLKNDKMAWITGENFAFTNWNTGEPNNYNGHENVCVMYKDGTWNDTNEQDIGHGFICEYEPFSYSITYNLNGGTNNKENPTSYTKTTPTITLRNPNKTGYTFSGWYSDSKFTNKVTTINTGSTGNKTLYAKWIKSSTSNSEPTPEPEEPTPTPSPTPEPTPTPEPSPNWTFNDVPQKTGNWKYEAVKYVTEKGIMNGTAPNEFKPDDSLTRAMFATMLYRMAGQPAVTFTNKFPDVPAGTWYSNAVIWASEKGIVGGYGDGRFGTNDFITREQIAKMLMQFGKVQGYDVSQSADFSTFADASSVSGWATSYMKWAVGSGMIGGKTINGKLCIAPKGNATRAESATMLMRFMEKY